MPIIDSDRGKPALGELVTTVVTDPAVREFFNLKTKEAEIIVDPATGGKKGRKEIELMQVLRQCPPHFLTDLGRVYEMGARKYGEDNWRKGYAWSLNFNAMLRHLRLAMAGEWFDEESGLPHVVHVAWHCAALHEFHRAGLGTDDRSSVQSDG